VRVDWKIHFKSGWWFLLPEPAIIEELYNMYMYRQEAFNKGEKISTPGIYKVCMIVIQLEGSILALTPFLAF
jgi:hypothetical protein